MPLYRGPPVWDWSRAFWSAVTIADDPATADSEQAAVGAARGSGAEAWEARVVTDNVCALQPAEERRCGGLHTLRWELLARSFG